MCALCAVAVGADTGVTEADTVPPSAAQPRETLLEDYGHSGTIVGGALGFHNGMLEVILAAVKHQERVTIKHVEAVRVFLQGPGWI